MLRNNKPWTEIMQPEGPTAVEPDAARAPDAEPAARQGERHGGERRQGERRSGERRQGERRNVDAWRTQVQWTIAPEEEPPSLRQKLAGAVKVSPSRMFLLVVALIAGGLAAYMASLRDTPMAQTVNAPPPVEVAAPATTPVLVAKTAIAVGQRLKADMVGWQDWPNASLHADYVNEKSKPDAIAEMTGAVARVQILAGEPIRPDKLVKGDQGFLATVLDRGMRAVSVSVSSDSASGGFISPGDHVDVVLTRQTVRSEVEGSRLRSDTILANVKVLAINQRLGQSGAGAEPENPDRADADTFKGRATATLELDPTQAAAIINAAAIGQLSLVLRSAVDLTAGQGPGPNSANQAIRVSSPFWTK